MAETEDQQDSVAQNEDDQYEPQDQTLEPEQYEPQDQSLEPHQYKPQEQSLEPKTYEPQAQILELHQYKPQQQSLEPQKYEVNPDQKEYQEYQVQVQEQDRAHEEMKDPPLTKPQYQPQEQDHEQYQLQVQAHEHNGGGGTSKHVQSQLKSKLEDEEKRWPGWPGETVFRMLVPAQKVGRIIGRKGDVINKIAEETRARIKILDGPPDTIERVVMISAKEEPESSLPPSINALLRVHMRIIDGLDNDSKISTRLLVPTYQAGNLIGKQGKMIKPIREATGSGSGSGSGVRVLGVEDVPVFSLQDDRVVQVVGEPSSVHKSLELIASYLRMFLVDPSSIPFFETQMKKPSMDPASHMHHQNISAYRREPPMNIHVSAAPSMAALQVSQQIQIPLSYTDAVIGESDLNISYTRRVSGALVNIQETRGVAGELTVEIRGTGLQVHTAQQLIHNFMAAPAEQGYNQE